VVEHLSYAAPISRTSTYAQAQTTEARRGRASPYMLCWLRDAGILAGDKSGSYGED